MVWRTHLLHPVAYVNACARLTGASLPLDHVPGPSVLYRDDGDDGGGHDDVVTTAAAGAGCGSDDGSSGDDSADNDNGDDHTLGVPGGLVAGLRRQEWFMRMILREREALMLPTAGGQGETTAALTSSKTTAHATLSAAVRDYAAFLRARGAGRDGGGARPNAAGRPGVAHAPADASAVFSRLSAPCRDFCGPR